MAECYIEFKNVVKKFDSFVALDHVSLQIPRGAFVTLLGPSGCGKTTLMRQLAGFSEPEEGDVIVNGRRVNGLPPFKRNTPLVFQEYALFPHMTVYENISYGLKLQKLPKKEIDARVAAMLEMFNLKGLEKRFPRQMSGGQQQRVGIARAFVTHPEVVFADEPTGNLDTRTTKEVMHMIRGFAKRFHQTIVLVSHDPEMTEYADRIVTLIDGRIVSNVENQVKAEIDAAPYIE